MPPSTDAPSRARPDPIATARELAEALKTSSLAEVAATVGHGVPWVRDTVALLQLTEEEQASITAGTMSKAAGLRLLKQRANPHTSRGDYIDEIAELLAENLAALVAAYAPKGAEHGVGKAQIRKWLTDSSPLTYHELAPLYGVEVDTVYQWTVDGVFIKPDVNKGARVRLWNRNRAILYGWRTGKLQPGTLDPRRQKSPGRPKKTAAAEP